MKHIPRIPSNTYPMRGVKNISDEAWIAGKAIAKDHRVGVGELINYLILREQSKRLKGKTSHEKENTN